MFRTFSFSAVIFFSVSVSAQSPEISLREFASGQVKKGVRTLGMGGDGATWGNYSIVYRDSATALIDAGTSAFTNGNRFGFTAVAATTPDMGKGFTLYAIALSQYTNNTAIALKPIGSSGGSVPVHGDGSNQSFFLKASMPLGKGFSAGVLLSYERSQFDATGDNNPGIFARFKTEWRPSGGFGITWQPGKRILIGFRGLFNNDLEVRRDNSGTFTGQNNVQEYRLGISAGVWQGALIDLGGNLRHSRNAIYHTDKYSEEPNLGFEQNLSNRKFAFRFGLDEESETAGFSLRFKPVVFDFAYVHNIGSARFGTLFGTTSNSFIGTLVVDYRALMKK